MEELIFLHVLGEKTNIFCLPLFSYLEIKFSSNYDILHTVHCVFVYDNMQRRCNNWSRDTSNIIHNMLRRRNARSCDTGLCLCIPDVLGSCKHTCNIIHNLLRRRNARSRDTSLCLCLPDVLAAGNILQNNPQFAAEAQCQVLWHRPLSLHTWCPWQL